MYVISENRLPDERVPIPLSRYGVPAMFLCSMSRAAYRHKFFLPEDPRCASSSRLARDRGRRLAPIGYIHIELDNTYKMFSFFPFFHLDDYYNYFLCNLSID